MSGATSEIRRKDVLSAKERKKQKERREKRKKTQAHLETDVLHHLAAVSKGTVDEQTVRVPDDLDKLWNSVCSSPAEQRRTQ